MPSNFYLPPLLSRGVRIVCTLSLTMLLLWGTNSPQITSLLLRTLFVLAIFEADSLLATLEGLHLAGWLMVLGTLNGLLGIFIPAIFAYRAAALGVGITAVACATVGFAPRGGAAERARARYPGRYGVLSRTWFKGLPPAKRFIGVLALILPFAIGLAVEEQIRWRQDVAAAPIWHWW